MVLSQLVPYCFLFCAVYLTSQANVDVQSPVNTLHSKCAAVRGRWLSVFGESTWAMLTLSNVQCCKVSYHYYNFY